MQGLQRGLCVHRMCQGWHQREPCRAMNSWAGAAGGAAGTLWVVTVEHWRGENQQLLLIFTPGSFFPSLLFSQFFSPFGLCLSFIKMLFFHENAFLPLKCFSSKNNYLWEGFCSGEGSVLLQNLLLLLLPMYPHLWPCLTAVFVVNFEEFLAISLLPEHSADTGMRLDVCIWFMHQLGGR